MNHKRGMSREGLQLPREIDVVIGTQITRDCHSKQSVHRSGAANVEKHSRAFNRTVQTTRNKAVREMQVIYPRRADKDKLSKVSQSVMVSNQGIVEGSSFKKQHQMGSQATEGLLKNQLNSIINSMYNYP